MAQSGVAGSFGSLLAYRKRAKAGRLMPRQARQPVAAASTIKLRQKKLPGLRKSAGLARINPVQRAPVFRTLDRAVRLGRAQVVMVGEGTNFRAYQVHSPKIKGRRIIAKSQIKPDLVVDNTTYEYTLQRAKGQIGAHNVTSNVLLDAHTLNVIDQCARIVRRRSPRDRVLIEKLESLKRIAEELSTMHREEVAYFKAKSEMPHATAQMILEMSEKANRAKGAADEAARLRKRLSKGVVEFRQLCGKQSLDERTRALISNELGRKPDVWTPRLFGTQMSFQGPIDVFAFASTVPVVTYYVKSGREARIGQRGPWEEHSTAFVNYPLIRRFIPYFARMFSRAERAGLPLDVNPRNFALDLFNKRLMYIDTSEVRGGPPTIENMAASFLVNFGRYYPEEVGQMRARLLGEIARHVKDRARLARIREEVDRRLKESKGPIVK